MITPKTTPKTIKTTEFLQLEATNIELQISLIEKSEELLNTALTLLKTKNRIDKSIAKHIITHIEQVLKDWDL